MKTTEELITEIKFYLETGEVEGQPELTDEDEEQVLREMLEDCVQELEHELAVALKAKAKLFDLIDAVEKL